ncbi:MAG: DUF167 domain-containing protein [DPANN group archaeon]|nr:DUF167 domain-containing protein [DPANN group archaeon]
MHLRIKVKPNSPETKIIQAEHNAKRSFADFASQRSPAVPRGTKGSALVSQNGVDLVVAVHAPAEDNKANIELIKFLKKWFGAEVRIVRGLKSKRKVVKICLYT